jgi:hypothetical protein
MWVLFKSRAEANRENDTNRHTGWRTFFLFIYFSSSHEKMLKIENWIKIWEVKPQKEGMKRETHIQKKMSEESVRNTTDSLNLIDMQIVPGLMGVFSWQGWRDCSKLPRESTFFPAVSLPEKLCSLPFRLHRYTTPWSPHSNECFLLLIYFLFFFGVHFRFPLSLSRQLIPSIS